VAYRKTMLVLQGANEPQYLKEIPDGSPDDACGREMYHLTNWGVLAEGQQIRPLNREDLLKLIKLNGGTYSAGRR